MTNSGKLNLILGARNGAKTDREKNDFYATDPKSVELFLDTLQKDNVKLNQNIWECACGKGHISEVLKKYGYTVFSTDLINRGYSNCLINFLSSNSQFFNLSKTDILTNPPYKDAEAFVLKALELLETGCKVVMYLKIQFLEGANRLNKIFKKYPPKFVYVHSTRQSIAKDGDFKEYCKTSGTLCYAWFIWEKGYHNETILRWIGEKTCQR